MGAQANLAPEGREVGRVPDIGAVDAGTDVPAGRTAAMGSTPLDCNDKGVLTLRSDVADPATGNE
jgi:hypothetical protein